MSHLHKIGRAFDGPRLMAELYSALGVTGCTVDGGIMLDPHDGVTDAQIQAMVDGHDATPRQPRREALRAKAKSGTLTAAEIQEALGMLL